MIFAAIALAVGISSSFATTLLTRPMRYASAASTLSHVKIISLARPIPTKRASLCVPPKPGMIPSPVSGCPKIAFSEAILISHAIEISHPPPSANPLTAAIVT